MWLSAWLKAKRISLFALFDLPKTPLNGVFSSPPVAPAFSVAIFSHNTYNKLQNNSKSNPPSHLPAFSRARNMRPRTGHFRSQAILRLEKPPRALLISQRTTTNMNRQERRAAAHKDRKLARKAGFPTPQPAQPPPAATPEPVVTPETPTISDAQLNANRANAQLSSGPKTEAGRAVSSQNRTTHGLARHNGTFVLLSTEDPNGFEALKASLAEEHQPSTETESILINGMAESHWLANRAQSLQNTCLDPQTGQITDASLFSLYLRYQTTHTRAFHKCLNDFVKLRSEKRKTENGFEAQNRKNEELRLKNERHEMKKEHHEWDIRLKDAAFCHRVGQNVSHNNQAARENPGFEAQYIAEVEAKLNRDREGAQSSQVAQSAAA